MKSYEEYQKELAAEIQQKLIGSDELDDVAGLAKPEHMSAE